MRQNVEAVLFLIGLLGLGGLVGWAIGRPTTPDPILPYSPTTCYIVETGYTRIVADEWSRKAFIEACYSFSLEGKEIGVLCGNVDILNIPPAQCQKMVRELNEPSLKEEKKG